MKILIVDDKVEDRTLLRYMVEHHGAEALEAENGVEGLRLAELHSPRLIISDALMPIMDGFQFLRAVKQQPRLASIPFLLSSASYQGGDDVGLAMSLGAAAYILKPIDPVALWKTIEDLTGKDSQMPPPVPDVGGEEYLKRYSRVVVHKLEDKVAELEQAVKEKETLLRELYHRTKNTLQLISAFLSLEAQNFPGSPEFGSFFGRIELRIQAIALVHQMLYGAQNLSQVSIEAYIRELTALILSSFVGSEERIQLKLDLAPVPVLIDTAIPMGLIINELMMNSLKHAFPEGRRGSISLSLVLLAEQRLQFRYSDDGVGVPEGFDFGENASLGLSLVHGLARQLGGTAVLACHGGVECLIEFPRNLNGARV